MQKNSTKQAEGIAAGSKNCFCNFLTEAKARPQNMKWSEDPPKLFKLIISMYKMFTKLKEKFFKN
jgi:hypothetical protein